MKRIAMAVLAVVCTSAFAAEKAEAAKTEKTTATKTEKTTDAKAEKTTEKKADTKAEGSAMMMPVHKAVKEDKKGIDELYAEMEKGWKTGDMDAVAARVDFPVMMATDDSKGQTMTQMWTKDQWVKTMGDTMKNMPKDMQMKSEHKAITMLSEDMAVVVTDHKMTMGKNKQSWKGADYVVKKDGKWMVKGMMESGWGDMGKAEGGAAKGMK